MDIDLSKVIGYSRDSLQSRALMRSIMLDLYPGKTREMNVLLDVYESGVPRKIKNDGNITDAKYAQYIQKIVDDYGMQEQWAVVGLNAWIDVCLGKGTAATIMYRVVTVPSNGGNASNGNTVGGGYTNPIVHNNSAPINNTPVQGNASDYEIADLGNGTIEIKKFVGFDQADTIIPTEISGKKVVGIRSGAFQQCKGIKQLIIPEGIEYVEDGAFADCSNLIKIVLPNALSRIGNQNSRSIGLGHKGAFQGTAISEIDLPNLIKVIPRSCFSNCKQLRKVQFPDTLEEISSSAFWVNEKLTDIQLPPTVRKIGSSAFYGCTSLSNVNLNEGLKTIEGGAFENCSAIAEIIIPSTVETFGTDIFKCGYGGNKNILIKCYQGSRAIEYVRKNNHRLGSVTPSAQRNNGLSFADALQKVNPIKHNNFNSSSAPAIGNTSDYEIADLGNGTIEIKKFVGFDQADTVIPIEINGKRVVGIGNGAFQQCKGIKQLIIPEGIEYVEDGAFADCSNLMKIILPSTLRRLGS